jgi:hypothetical protein
MNSTARRPLAIGAAIAASAIVVSGAGVGYAANGGSFLLGRVNDTTRTTTLNNSAGTPLKLVGPAAKAPMVVSSNTKVNKLNADLVDGLDSSAFQRKGAIVRQGETTFTPSEGPINRQSRAFCQPGEHAVGGGGHVAALTEDRLGEYYTFIVHSNPIDASGEAPTAAGEATGWLVEATNTANHMTGLTGRDANLVSYVICEPN